MLCSALSAVALCDFRKKSKTMKRIRGIIEKLKFGELREAGLQVAKLHNKTPLLCLIC